MCASVMHNVLSTLPSCVVPDVAVALDKADMIATDYGSLVHHAISPVASLDKNDTSAGEQSGASSRELSVLSVYSVMAVMSVDPAGGSGSSSSGCALLLVDKDGQITATSEWIPVCVYGTWVCCACRSIVYTCTCMPLSWFLSGILSTCSAGCSH